MFSRQCLASVWRLNWCQKFNRFRGIGYRNFTYPAQPLFFPTTSINWVRKLGMEKTAACWTAPAQRAGEIFFGMNWDVFLILFSLILVIYPLVVLYINYHGNVPKLTSEQVDKSDNNNGDELLKKLIGQQASKILRSTNKTVYHNWGDNTLGCTGTI